MLCAKCKVRKATVHFTVIDGDKVSKIDMCEECAGPEMMRKPEGFELTDLMGALQSAHFHEGALEELASGEGARFPLEAYEFVREALWMHPENKPGHVGGGELLKAIRELALQKFGKGAKKKLNEWGIFRTEDFGEMVFEMIEAGVLSASPEDRIEDFADGFSFDEAFPEF